MRRVNVTLDEAVHERARALKINVSEVADTALRRAVRVEEARRWREENAHILAAQDEWLTKNGHPLEGAMAGPLAEAWRETE